MTMPSRRTILRLGVVSTAAAGPLGLAGKAFSMLGSAAAAELRRSVFAPLVGTTFTWSLDGYDYDAVLAAVEDLRAEDAGDELKFRMAFVTTGVGPLQNVVDVTHPALGPLALFVTPVGKEPGNYEAVVNAG